MGYQAYKDRDFLYQEYVIKRRNAKDIAEDFGKTEMTVYNWLKYHDLLKFRGKGRKLGSRKVRREW